MPTPPDHVRQAATTALGLAPDGHSLSTLQALAHADLVVPAVLHTIVADGVGHDTIEQWARSELGHIDPGWLAGHDHADQLQAVSPHGTSTSTSGWDGPANESRLRDDADASYYRQAYAWRDPGEDGTAKSHWSFVHHEVAGDGTVGPANVQACRTGIGILNGGRGVNPGDQPWGSDRDGIYRHLARHLRDAGEDPPEANFAAGDVDPDDLKTVTIRGVELVRAGTWWASTGRVRITPEHLEAMVAAAGDAEVDQAPVKLGHTTEPGQPALGWVENLRVSDDGMTLLGDLVDVPAGFARIMPSAYRRRSIEIKWGVRTASGQRHAAALTGLALLGVQEPAVKGLADLVDLYRDDAGRKVAAASGDEPATCVSVVDGHGLHAHGEPSWQDDGAPNHRLPTNATAQEDRMARYGKGIRRLLGLAADATDQQVQEALDARTADDPQLRQAIDQVDATGDGTGQGDGSGTGSGSGSGQGDGGGGQPAGGQPSGQPQQTGTQPGQPATGGQPAGDGNGTQPAGDGTGTGTGQGDGTGHGSGEPSNEPATAGLSAAALNELRQAGLTVVDDQTLTSLQAGAQAGQQANAHLAEQQRETALQAAVNEGRIRPTDLDKWRQRLRDHPDSMFEVLREQPQVVPVSELGSAHDPANAGGEDESSYPTDWLPEVNHDSGE